MSQQNLLVGMHDVSEDIPNLQPQPPRNPLDNPRRTFSEPAFHHQDQDENEVIIVDDTNEENSRRIAYCRQTFLRPYEILLSLVGLRPSQNELVRRILLDCATLIVISLLFVGYVLQYFTKFRRDQGLSVKHKHNASSPLLTPLQKEIFDIGEDVFAYFIPTLLHFFGYLSGIYVFRIVDHEQFYQLIARVFVDCNAYRKISRRLWLFFGLGALWVVLMTIYVSLLGIQQVCSGRIEWFNNLSPSLQTLVKFSLIFTVMIHDSLQVIMTTSYCIECYLLKAQLNNLNEKLYDRDTQVESWMRDVLEFRSLLNHLNRKVSTPVCFFTVLNLSYGFSALFYLFKEYDMDKTPAEVHILNLANCIMWFIIGFTPFFLAAALTRACHSAQASGHRIRARRYNSVSAESSDSLMIFASSLTMSGKLFLMPIQYSYLCFAILILSISILTFGMYMNASFNVF